MAKVPVLLPRVGLVMETARVLRWLRAEGDSFTQGEPLVEVETEKTTLEVEAPFSGRLLQILAADDTEVAVGMPIAWADDGAAEAATPEAAAPAPAAQPEAAAPVTAAPPTSPASAAHPPARHRASPVARRLARAHGIALATVPGTGPGGRITLADVERAVAGATTAPAAADPAPSTGPATVPPAAGRRALTPMRRAVARAMTLSATVPQFPVSRSVDWTQVQTLRTLLNPGLEQSRGLSLSPNDFLLQAVARTLAAYPAVNATFVGDATGPDCYIEQAAGFHIGLVVAVDDGMVVPVLHHHEVLPLVTLAERRADLVERARAGRLRGDEAGGATFAISNLGASGPDRFVAMLNPPAAAILAVGRTRDLPVVRDGAVTIRPMTELTLTVDHRLIDGRLAADFLHHLSSILEGNDWLVL